jgi:hypothetical protein
VKIFYPYTGTSTVCAKNIFDKLAGPKGILEDFFSGGLSKFYAIFQ